MLKKKWIENGCVSFAFKYTFMRTCIHRFRLYRKILLQYCQNFINIATILAKMPKFNCLYIKLILAIFAEQTTAAVLPKSSLHAKSSNIAAIYCQKACISIREYFSIKIEIGLIVLCLITFIHIKIMMVFKIKSDII